MAMVNIYSLIIGILLKTTSIFYLLCVLCLHKHAWLFTTLFI